MKKIKLFILIVLFPIVLKANPVNDLLNRLQPGASKRFKLELQKGQNDFFELEKKGNKIHVRANTNVNLATGIRWYLKYYANINISWNNMTISLPEILPFPDKKIRKETDISLRYDLNYCTYSYSMAFWDWNRWEKEIDWMALQGINMPLAITGTETVWYNVLKKLGYTHDEINEFISGPGFFAWWLMNNLEGWGGPNPQSWYKDRVELQKKIIARMRELHIEPVFAGYSGMVPNNANQKLGLSVSDPGKWCGYLRPAFLLPTDSGFQKIAKLYYDEMTKLFGKANYYSMDPFHEGGNIEGVDLSAAGIAIMDAMKRCNPNAVWVAQAWQENPREEMIKSLNVDDLIVLDLYSESRPQWGDINSTWYRKDGFNDHNWIYCMLLNYGGNVGLHGKMQHVIDGYYKAKQSKFGKTMKGVGLTMEGIENNPVMYELLCELPWHKEQFSKDEWLKGYISSRYGAFDQKIYDAWIILANSIYNCPAESTQQGAHESIFCARPSDSAFQVSSFSEMSNYYDPMRVIEAAILFESVADKYKGNNNYEYDLIDILRQAISEKGRLVYKIMMDSKSAGEKALFVQSSERFMKLLLLQDNLLSNRPEFRLDNWLKQARELGHTLEEKDLYEWNAKVQITTWGNRNAANNGGLRDYAHKEWNGLLSSLYAMRWQKYIDNILNNWGKINLPGIDYYAIEEAWVNADYSEANSDEKDVTKAAKEAVNILE